VRILNGSRRHIRQVRTALTRLEKLLYEAEEYE
jgi:hypothetical protein